MYINVYQSEGFPERDIWSLCVIPSWPCQAGRVVGKPPSSSPPPSASLWDTLMVVYNVYTLGYPDGFIQCIYSGIPWWFYTMYILLDTLMVLYNVYIFRNRFWKWIPACGDPGWQKAYIISQQSDQIHDSGLLISQQSDQIVWSDLLISQQSDQIPWSDLLISQHKK